MEFYQLLKLQNDFNHDLKTPNKRLGPKQQGRHPDASQRLLYSCVSIFKAFIPYHSPVVDSPPEAALPDAGDSSQLLGPGS